MIITIAAGLFIALIAIRVGYAIAEAMGEALNNSLTRGPSKSTAQLVREGREFRAKIYARASKYAAAYNLTLEEYLRLTPAEHRALAAAHRPGHSSPSATPGTLPRAPSGNGEPS
jgi:hypothetical protein